MVGNPCKTVISRQILLINIIISDRGTLNAGIEITTWF